MAKKKIPLLDEFNPKYLLSELNWIDKYQSMLGHEQKRQDRFFEIEEILLQNGYEIVRDGSVFKSVKIQGEIGNVYENKELLSTS